MIRCQVYVITDVQYFAAAFADGNFHGSQCGHEPLSELNIPLDRLPPS